MFLHLKADPASYEGLFEKVKYYVTGTLDESVQTILEGGGAKKTAYLSGINTHCIVGADPDYNEVSEAVDMLDVPSVQQEWVPASVLCKKLLPLRAFFPEEKKLLSGVSIFVGEAGGGGRDLGKADKESLWATITYHGGKVASSLQDPGVSHLIVALPLGSSYNQGLNMESLQVVGPDWVMDSVRAGKRCEEALYHPRLLTIPENPAPQIPKSNKSGPGRAVTDQLKPKLSTPVTPSSTAAGPRPVLVARGPNLPGQAPTPPPQQPVVSMAQQRQIQATTLPRPPSQPTATSGPQGSGVPSQAAAGQTQQPTGQVQPPSLMQTRPSGPGQVPQNQIHGTQPGPIRPQVPQSQPNQMQVRPQSQVPQNQPGQLQMSQVTTPTPSSQPGQMQQSQMNVRRSTPGPMPQSAQMRMTTPSQMQPTHQGQPGQQQHQAGQSPQQTTLGQNQMGRMPGGPAVGQVQYSQAGQMQGTPVRLGQPGQGVQGNLPTGPSGQSIQSGHPGQPSLGGQIGQQGSQLGQPGGQVGQPQQQGQPGQLVSHPGQSMGQPGQAMGQPRHQGPQPGQQGQQPRQQVPQPRQQGPQPGQQGSPLGQQGPQPVQQGPQPGQQGQQPVQQGPQPGQQGPQPGQQGLQPGQQGSQPGQQGPQPGQQGLQPGQQGTQPAQQALPPGQQGLQPGQQGPHNGQQGPQPGQQGPQPGQPNSQLGQQSMQPGQQSMQPGQQIMQPGQQGSQMVRPGQPQSHPAILQQHEQQLQLQQQQSQSIPGQQQQWQPGQQQQQQFMRPGMQQQGQQQWQQGQQPQQQGMMQQPRLVGQVPARPMTPHMQRQQQIIQQHIQGISMEQRQQFSQMTPPQKQQYLAERNLLLPNPRAGWGPGGQQVQLQRHTIQLHLTEQQKQMLTSMDPEQRAVYLQKLQKDQMQQQQQRQLMQRQQMLQQQQQGGQGIPAQQPGLQPGQQQPALSQPGMVSTGGQFPAHSPTPGSPLHSMGSLSPGHVSPNRMPSPGAPGLRGAQAWSGDPHPALAQVPRTPQQIQHLQRLQMQRQGGVEGGTTSVEQVGIQPGQQGPQPGQQGPQSGQQGPQSGQQGPQPGQQGLQPGQQGSQPGQSGLPVQGGMMTAQMQQQRMLQQQQNPNNTKAALQNMLTTRMGPGGQPLPPSASVSMAPDGTAANRLQMMNQQLQQGGMMPSPQHSPQQQAIIQQQQQQALQQQQAAQQQQMLAMRQRQVPMGGPGGIPSSPVHQHGPGMMPGARFPPRAVMPGLRPGGMPGVPQQRMHQFVGHAIETRLPPDLCLLGCIFVMVDYQDSDEARHISDWRRVITQYGGEIEDALGARVTHVLAKDQKSATAQQARIEGKRLVTAFWLNDTVVRKKVLPPWKAIHFPLPANFEPPCVNMILTLTGFEDRDRDYVKEMIKTAGATYTSYFSKHNHAIICKNRGGEKFEKAREWRVPAVSIQWLNDVLFGSMNAAQSMNNPRYQQFKPEEPLRIDYTLVPHLIQAWKVPIRVTPETYQKFKANPPARIKRKAEKQRQEREAEERKRKVNEERAAQGLPPLETLEPPPEVKESINESEPLGAEAMEVEEAKVEEPVVKEEQMEVEENGGGAAEIKPIILLSGVESVHRKELMGILGRLGGVYAGAPQQATHLVMPQLRRTDNLLLCLPSVQFVLSTAWMEESGSANRWLPEAEYTLNNPEFEAMYQFSLSKTLARTNRDKLFAGKIFYLTPSVRPSMAVLQNIIQFAGGKVENRRRKSTDQIREVNSGGNINYIIITCEEDIHLITDVLKAKLGVYTPEFVLKAVMRVEMDFELSQYLTTHRD